MCGGIVQKCTNGDGGQNGVNGAVHATNGVGGQKSTNWLGQNRLFTTVWVIPPAVPVPTPAACGAAPTAPEYDCVVVYMP